MSVHTLKINVERNREEELEEIKNNINVVRNSLGLHRGACSTENFTLMKELLGCWMDHNRDKLLPSISQSGVIPDTLGSDFTFGGEPDANRGLQMLGFTPPAVSASSVLARLNNELGLVDDELSSSVPGSLPIQPKQQLFVACDKEDEIYTVCKASLANLVSHLIREHKQCDCGYPWDAGSLSIKRCTPNNHVCKLEIQCQAPVSAERHTLQWHSSTIVAGKYYNNLRHVVVRPSIERPAPDLCLNG